MLKIKTRKADTYLVLSSDGRVRDSDGMIVQKRSDVKLKKLYLPDGRSVQALPRSLFEVALRAATLKE
jgi:hypothetical protein